LNHLGHGIILSGTLLIISLKPSSVLGRRRRRRNSDKVSVHSYITLSLTNVI